MTVEFWTSAERFYELWFVLLSLFFLFLILVFLFIFTYTNKKNWKKVLLLMLSCLGAVGFVSFYSHSKYQPYLEQASYVNPLIRDREPRLHIYMPYSQTEQMMYEQLNDIDSLRKMVLYEEEKVVEPICYLGKDKNYYYFEHPTAGLFKETFHIEFSEVVKEPQLKGSRFTLKNESFQKIGFKNPRNIMYDKIMIPASQQEKIFTNEQEEFISRTEKVFHQWNF